MAGIHMDGERTNQTETLGDTAPQESSDRAGAESVSEGDELRQAYDELHDRYLRLAADFENFKKRNARETEERVTYAIEHFAVEILDVVDNLERAVGSDDDSLREGLEQIHKLVLSILTRHGIAPINCKETRFDPGSQEAIAYVPSAHEEGVVIDEITRGYTMGDKVIRCAKVAVSKGKEEKE
jgi:molecular chaperone GrpE